MEGSPHLPRGTCLRRISYVGFGTKISYHRSSPMFVGFRFKAHYAYKKTTGIQIKWTRKRLLARPSLFGCKQNSTKWPLGKTHIHRHRRAHKDTWETLNALHNRAFGGKIFISNYQLFPTKCMAIVRKISYIRAKQKEKYSSNKLSQQKLSVPDPKQLKTNK